VLSDARSGKPAMTVAHFESVWRGTADCQSCAMRELVLFADLKELDLAFIHAPIDDLNYGVGALLFNEGGPVRGIFTLRSGMVKLVRSTLDGRPRIVRVVCAGEVVGLEALANTSYSCDAVALTPVSACRIPLEVIHSLSAKSPRLHGQLMKKWQHALKDADDWLADMNFGNARRRVGNLLLKMREADPDGISHVFSRDDMGAMLDLKLETVSREISRFIRDGLIEQLDKQGRIYRVLQADKLVLAD
jgi:CRP-like cAMP-binding protein